MEIISKNPPDSEIVARWIIEECNTPIDEITWLLKQAYDEKGIYGEYDSVIKHYKEKNKRTKNNA